MKASLLTGSFLIGGGVHELIENGFQDFLNFEFLYQDQDNHGYYKNIKYGIWFFHDFDKYNSLESQLPKVKERYKRRIERFYKVITNPTLFIRYISSANQEEGKSLELDEIERDYEKILKLLKKFNSQNEIVFIANSDISSNKIKIFNVEKDKEDSVARMPFEKNAELRNYFDGIEFEGKEENISRFLRKSKRNKVKNLFDKINRKRKELFCKEYIHKNQIKRI